MARLRPPAEVLSADRPASDRAAQRRHEGRQTRWPVLHGAEPLALECQQALVLEMLRRAAGTPVTYAQLQDAGIEFPASVVSELELAGVSVERCDVHERGARRLAGVRVDPSRERPEMPAGTSAVAQRDGRVVGARRALGDRISKPSWPVAALLACGAAVALVLLALPGGRARDVALTHRQLRPAISAAARRQVRAASGTRAGVGRQARPVSPGARTPVSPALAAQLDARGHELLERGRYGEAIVGLDRTLAATGENLEDCLQPTSEACLTYAYALYDLGRALRLDGNPAGAVPVLQRRLQIENQRPIVRAQLQLARAETG